MTGRVLSKGIRGFTLVEMMIVVAIIAILASLAVPMYRRMIATADAMVSSADIKEIAQAIDLYYLTYGHYPDSLADVGKDKVMDPWGRPYQYLRLDNLIEEEEEEVEEEPEPEPVAAASNSNGNGNNGKGGKGNSGNGNSGNGGNGNSGGNSGNGNSGGNSGNGNSGGNGGGNKNVKGARKDKNLHPINTDYDLYSMGPDGESNLPLTAKASRDDIIRANNGGFFGVASTY